MASGGLNLESCLGLCFLERRRSLTSHYIVIFRHMICFASPLYFGVDGMLCAGDKDVIIVALPRNGGRHD